MLRKIIAGVLSVVLLSSNFAMAASEDQQKVSDSVAPIENVEFVRDDSIPQAYSIDVPNCSYAELSKAIAEGNITQTLPGDIPIYDEELLWNFDIPDMEEPIDITRRESNGVIAITYITAEDYVIANFYPNEDYEIYAKPLVDLEDGSIIRVQECKSGNVDNYALRRQVTITYERNNASRANDGKDVALHPTCFGCFNTSEAGINESNGQMLCKQLNKYVYVRSSLIERNFARKTVPSRTRYAVNTAVSLISMDYATKDAYIFSVLALAEVVVSATERIQEMIYLEKNPVYTATYGRCGDVQDITTFAGKYCRVIDKTINATYTYGRVVGTSYNSFVRTVYNITAQEVREQALYNYNMCITAHGANTLYYPI